MVTSITAGAVLGLSAGFAPGPLLALVITQTLRHNTREGLKVALSPLITDLPIILFSLFLLNGIADYRMLLAVISFIGGGYVLFLSYESWKTVPLRVSSMDAQPKSLLKGAIVNALNPHPYLFWLTVGGPFLVGQSRAGWLSPALFLLSFYVFLIGSKIGLAVVSGRSQTFLSGRRYVTVMRVLGLLLAAFAVLLLREAWLLLNQ